jgi:hypothetical protein
LKISKISWQERLARIFYFFPLQLLLLQFKSNWFLIVFWAIPWLVVTESFGSTYGIPTTILFPEYLSKVDFVSHFILGFSLGGFIMAYHISSYISNGYKFPFIATLSRPFYKYTLNNSIIPLVFLVFLGYKTFHFQVFRELISEKDAITNLLGLYLGCFVFIIISMAYFLGTNKNIQKTKIAKEEAIADLLHKEKNWSDEIIRTQSWRIKTYLGDFLKIRLANSGEHYDDNLLKSIIKQNHINASLFEFALIITVILLGIFGENSLFFIPAGASAFLILTLILMIYSALRSWLNLWTPLVLILLIFGVNTLSKYQFFNYSNQAYGMKYDSTKAPYNTQTLKAHISNTRQYENDILKQEHVLDKWKKKVSSNNQKPKLVLVNCSGGGLRSAAWTFNTLSYLDSLTQGDFFKNVHLISGSSGGILSASYYRELYRKQKIKNENFNLHEGFENLTRDLLNPIIYTFVVRDIFYRPNNFEFENQTYIRDRALIFEMLLHQNLDSAFYHPLSFYEPFETESQIPTVVLAPTIVNDGRRMIISASSVSFLTNNFRSTRLNYIGAPESIEFKTFFKNQNAENVAFSSALRMSATFPYVLPNVSLPSDPTIEVMDAGVRDNFGLLNNLNYIFHLKDWINENTSGVVIVQIRDTPKEIKITQNPVLSLFKSLSNPLGGFTKNWLKIQTYDQDLLIQFLADGLNTNISIYDLALKSNPNEEIPISWHLTQNERENIKNAIEDSPVKNQISKLLEELNLGNE